MNRPIVNKDIQLIILNVPQRKVQSQIASLANLTKHSKKNYYSSLVAQMVKHLSTMQETWVQSLAREDSLEKEIATHSSTLALKIPWSEELGAGYYPWGRKELGTTSLSFSHTSKVMLKILQARLQQYMNHELPDIQAGFRKGRGTRDQIANNRWIIKKARVPERHLFLLY